MKPLVLYIINESSFFRSHFASWAKTAQYGGFDTALLSTMDPQATLIQRDGVRLYPSLAARRQVFPSGLWKAAGQVKDISSTDRQVVLHAFGLHGMTIAFLARLRGVQRPMALSITGLGYLAAGGIISNFVATIVAKVLRLALDHPDTHWLIENRDDGRRIGLRRATLEGRVTKLMGAGVDLATFPVKPQPPRPPLRLLLVARMVRSKGIDLAVAAVKECRERGANVTLTLVGEPDKANPDCFSDDEISAFEATPGVRVLGRKSNIAELMSEHHVCILPSRGGEGVPRVLLEAAACGRPSIVSNVAGCNEFVDSQTGFVAEKNSVSSFIAAIQNAMRADLGSMGELSRVKVAQCGTIEITSGHVIRAYKRVLRI